MMHRHGVVMVGLVVSAVVAQAQAAQTPTSGSLDKRVTNVTYQENNVVQVPATYGVSTMVIFDEAEKFETISLGDTDSWQVVPAQKGNILFIKPIAKKVTTNMNVVTDKRIYFFELHDFDPGADKEIFGIRFLYPDKSLNMGLRKEAEQRAAWPNIAGIDKANVNIDYSFSGDPRLRPMMIFDDGRKTFFQFGRLVPAIFAVTPDLSETLQNFRREGEFIVVDGVATQFTLRDGKQWTCIFNLRKPDLGAPDAGILGPVKDDKATWRRRSGNG